MRAVIPRLCPTGPYAHAERHSADSISSASLSHFVALHAAWARTVPSMLLWREHSIYVSSRLGPISQSAFGALEGFVFGAALALAMRYSLTVRLDRRDG